MELLVDPYCPGNTPGTYRFGWRWGAFTGGFGDSFELRGRSGATTRRIILLVLLRLVAFLMAIMPYCGLRLGFPGSKTMPRTSIF